MIINGKRTAGLKSGSISFKNYFKQLAALFKIYSDFECFLSAIPLNAIPLKGVKNSDKKNSSHTEKYQNHIPGIFAYKFLCIDNKLSKKIVLYREENAISRFIEAILNEHDYCKKNNKKEF